MSRQSIACFIAAVVLLSSCSRGTGRTDANAAAPADAATADAMPNAVVPAGAPIDQTFVARSWGTDNCDRTMTFHPDGTLTNGDDADVSHWSLAGNTLTITSPGDTPHPTPVTRQGDKLIMGDGPQLMTYVPCPAPSASPAK